MKRKQARVGVVRLRKRAAEEGLETGSCGWVGILMEGATTGSLKAGVSVGLNGWRSELERRQMGLYGKINLVVVGRRCGRLLMWLGCTVGWWYDGAKEDDA
ncbi:Hypothetical predicted protein [Prunus dulcis]|uniref:Uncharacterized protein n=1 Tax=Prunus dulcis TaxID=3755 RepID=A0A5E4GJG8_PRUDU|nr:Hypothetical predicted protein [Prunus dulcis]VVA39959.1 Hypothetical predicted protein [Prunus dulcis]